MKVYEFGSYRPYSWRVILLLSVLSMMIIDNNLLQNFLLAPLGVKFLVSLVVIIAVVNSLVDSSNFITFLGISTIFMFTTIINSGVSAYDNRGGELIESNFILSTHKMEFRKQISFKVVYNMGVGQKQEFEVYLYPRTLDSYKELEWINSKEYSINSSLQDFFYGLFKPYGKVSYEIKKSQSY
ncbi:MAG: hypothetical protein PHG82_03470 [Candidatus Gracilibacteria bacterium]|nr:hypothetical protein [Candidatus Gracilibacteria bacterium]